MVLYGQVALGPPGSGKTTYCNGMQQYLKLIGREAVVINLDPANEIPTASPTVKGDDEKEENDDASKNTEEGEEDEAANRNCLPYDAFYDVCEDLVNLTTVMAELGLGPNGGLVYCMEYIERHMDHVISTLKSRLLESSETKEIINPNTYILIDLPGQVELYTHCTCVRRILYQLSKSFDIRLTAVNLVDAHACVDATKFISAALLSTTSMIRLELPAVNVLSKIDLMERYTGAAEGGGGATMPFNLDYFTECQDLERLVDYIDSDPIGTNNVHNEEDLYEIEEDEEYRSAMQNARSTPFRKKHRKMHESLCEVIDDFGLLSFVPLNISDPVSVGRLVARVDKSNGYIFASTHGRRRQEENDDDGMADMFCCAVQLDQESEYEAITDVQERFLGTFCDDVPELLHQRRKL